MPHWSGLVDTASPEILRSCGGDPVEVEQKILESSPQGTNILEISWITLQDVARITVAGRNANRFLREELEARDVVELVTARERRDQMHAFA